MKFKYLSILLMLIVLVVPVIAVDNSTNVTNSTGPIYGSKDYPVRIAQGDPVYPGEYVDISGVAAGYNELAYWDGYGYYNEASSYNMSLPDTKAEYYQYYIDPAIFETRQGYWYRSNGYYERNGNNAAFFVTRVFNGQMHYANGSVFNITDIVEPTVTPQSPMITNDMPLEDQYVADYVVASGQDLVVTTDVPTHLWLFGRLHQILDVPTKVDYDMIQKKVVHTAVITSDMRAGFEPGQYDMLVVYPTDMGIYNVTYTNGKLSSPFKGVADVSIDGSQPRLTEEKLKQMLFEGSETFEVKKVEIQSPRIDVSSITSGQDTDWSAYTMASSSTHAGQVLVLSVRGYTNVLAGTNISLCIDPGFGSEVFYTRAEGSDLSSMRTYHAVIPMFMENYQPGMHDLEVKTEIGGQTTVGIPVSIVSNDSYHPDLTLKYQLGDENPWKPNLTTPPPVVVTVAVPGPVQTVVVEVTPAPEVIEAAQKKALDDKVDGILGAIFWSALSIGVALYAVSLYVRRKKLDY